MHSREVIQMLLDDGWYQVKGCGKGNGSSHKQFKHDTKRGRVTVAHPQKDIDKITLKSIWKQAGWD